MIPNQYGCELGLLVASYPQGASVDVLLPNSGARLTNVQVMMPGASSASGEFHLPDPGLPADDTRWTAAINTNPKLLVRAVIATYYNAPICLGFIAPQITQMTFERVNFKVSRHPSDWYTTISDTADFEAYHPSGSYFRMAVNPAHEDLTGLDFDELWKIARNTTAQVHARLVVANGGTVHATVDIDPSGNISITTSGTLDAMATGGMNLNQVAIDQHGNINTSGTINSGNLTATKLTSSGEVDASSAVKVGGTALTVP